MIVRRAILEDLEKLAGLFDEYRQFLRLHRSNLALSPKFLKLRLETDKASSSFMSKTM